MALVLQRKGTTSIIVNIITKLLAILYNKVRRVAILHTPRLGQLNISVYPDESLSKSATYPASSSLLDHLYMLSLLISVGIPPTLQYPTRAQGLSMQYT